MAIKNIIAKGIGFAPSTQKWIVTHGFASAGMLAVHASGPPVELLGVRRTPSDIFASRQQPLEVQGSTHGPVA